MGARRGNANGIACLCSGGPLSYTSCGEEQMPLGIQSNTRPLAPLSLRCERQLEESASHNSFRNISF